MAKTSVRVSFGLYALEIKQDSSVSSASPLQPFTKLADLENGMSTQRAYASYEPSFWLLDGEYKFLPESPYTTVHVGMMSTALSDGSGDFATDPTLTITFGEVHTTDGLALIFSPYTGDYCNSLTIAYYNASNALIRSDNYTPANPEFSTGQAVSNFKKIIITFHGTNRAYRYLRLTSIDYGELITFQGSEVKECSIVEEVNQISAEVPYSTMDLTLYSNEAQFSILNPEGKYVALKERQPLSVYETVDNVSRFIGNYYLDEWENPSETDYKFSASDILGVLDGMTYSGGIWLGTGISIDDLLEEILSPISVPYELDNTLTGTIVKGWLPTSSYRVALQQIGFAVGASITCARAGSLQIFRSIIAAAETDGEIITKAQKGISQSITLKPIVTSVQVTAHNYWPGGESQVLASGSYSVGVHEISFTEPMHALTISGATIIESGVNYAIFLVAAAGTVALTGLKYIDTPSVLSINTPDLNVSIRPNVLKVENATLVHSGNVVEVAQRVYDYHQQRYAQKLKLFAPNIQPGEVAIIDTLYNKQIIACIERMDSNLARGFVSNIETRGAEYVLG
jgi:hypothetical protein